MVGLLLQGLTGCGGDRPAQPASFAVYRQSGPACLRTLGAREIDIQPWRVGSSRSCSVDTPVRTSAARLAGFTPPLETSCAMLVAWSDFEPAMQQAALAHLGRRVRSVRHFGSFACRRMTGNAGRASLHAQARALDISGFILDDGQIVSVKQGWRGSVAERRFLRAVANAACRHFSVTLTPESDRQHHDHLHVDIGPWSVCGL